MGSRIRILRLLLCFTLLAVCYSAAQSPTSKTSLNAGGRTATTPSAGTYVYVGSNTSIGSTDGYVTTYVIGNNGVSLSVAGSSVSGPSNSLVVNSGYVFGTDGTNIATYTRGTTGGLTETSVIDGTAHNITPQGSAVGPMTLDLTGQTLYASEINYDGSDDDAYAFFGIGTGGVLSYINSIGSDVDYHSLLSFSPNDRYAYGAGCYFASWDIFGFTRGSDGTLTALNPQAAIPPGNNDPMYCPNGTSASAQNYLAVAYVDVSNPGSDYLLATYTLNNDGTLGLVPNSEITTPFTGENALAFDPSGTYLAVAGQAGIQMYQLSQAGLLTAIGSVVQGSAAFLSVQWDTSNHLYAITNTGLYVFNSNAGVLTLAPGSPYPLSDAGSLAVLPGS